MATRKRTSLTLLAVALTLAAVAASYYYAGWSRLRYLMADPQTRQRRDTEELERGYRYAAEALEQQLRTLPKDADILAAIENCNSVITNGKQKLIQIQKELVDKVKAFAAAEQSKGGVINQEAFHKLDELHLETLISDTLGVKEVRVDSVSDKPTSIRTDNNDLLQRYRGDVNITFSIHRRDGEHFGGSYTFVATANPDKQWTFPSREEVKQRIVAELSSTKEGMQSTVDLNVGKIKLEMESTLLKGELEVLTKSRR